MNNITDEIKSRLDIVDVISEYIQLKQSGTSFKAPCPFHREKIPSFFVSPDKQIWHCFGCNRGSDIFGFVQEIEGIEFPEALRILAQKAGVEVKQYDRRLVSQKTKLLDICRLSAKFYHKVLIESLLSKQAQKYLNQRGLNKKTIKEFELGFAPNKWDTLLKFLVKRGYKEKDIETAGLILKKQDQKSRYYDRFRNRIIFPICDLYSQVVGFTSRILPSAEEEETIAKYINTPETPIYNKSRVLYGLGKAKSEIKLEDDVILVEGNMDVLAIHQAGNKNVVCTSGTALTPEHVKLLQRYTQNILLAFDVDIAGQTATRRSIDILLQQGLDVKVIELEHGKDPDECIQENLRAWKKAVKGPLPIMEYYFSTAVKDKDLSNIEDKKKITKALLPNIAKLGDPVDKGLWLQKLSGKLDIPEIFLREAIKKVKPVRSAQTGPDAVNKDRVSQEQQAADQFLALILQYPQIGHNFLDKVILDMLVMPQAQDVLREIKQSYTKYKKIDVKRIKKDIKQDKKTSNYLDFLSFLVEKEFKDYTPEDVEQELNRLFAVLKKRYISKKMEKLVNQLKQAEKDNDTVLIKKISAKIVRLSPEIGE